MSRSVYKVTLTKRSFSVKVNLVDSTGALCATLAIDPNVMDVQSSEVYIGKYSIVDRLLTDHKDDLDWAVKSLYLQNPEQLSIVEFNVDI